MTPEKLLGCNAKDSFEKIEECYQNKLSIHFETHKDNNRSKQARKEKKEIEDAYEKIIAKKNTKAEEERKFSNRQEEKPATVEIKQEENTEKTENKGEEKIPVREKSAKSFGRNKVLTFGFIVLIAVVIFLLADTCCGIPKSSGEPNIEETKAQKKVGAVQPNLSVEDKIKDTIETTYVVPKLKTIPINTTTVDFDSIKCVNFNNESKLEEQIENVYAEFEMNIEKITTKTNEKSLRLNEVSKAKALFIDSSRKITIMPSKYSKKKEEYDIQGYLDMLYNHERYDKIRIESSDVKIIDAFTWDNSTKSWRGKVTFQSIYKGEKIQTIMRDVGSEEFETAFIGKDVKEGYIYIKLKDCINEHGVDTFNGCCTVYLGDIETIKTK